MSDVTVESGVVTWNGPLGVFESPDFAAGTRAVMQGLRPVGPSEHSGTYLAHLTAVLAALAALDEYSQPGFYERLNALGERFYGGLQSLIEHSGVPDTLQ